MRHHVSSEFRGQGFRISGPGSRVQSPRFRAHGSGFMDFVQGFCLKPKLKTKIFVLAEILGLT